MSDEMQAMCFFAGANSIFAGDTLLTAGNPGEDADSRLFAKLGIKPMTLEATAPNHSHEREPALEAGQRNARQS